MPRFDDIKKDSVTLVNFIDGSIAGIESAAVAYQQAAADAVRDFIFKLETTDGRLMSNQNYYLRLRRVEKLLRERLPKSSILRFLDDLGSIQDKTLDLHVKYNELRKTIEALDGARRVAYDTASLAFNADTIAAGYLRPMQNLVARQIITGASIKKTLALIDKWDEGELSSGRLNKGQPAPNFQRYAVQMARDSAYSINRATNEIVANELELDAFAYAGGLVADSRPLCVHLVRMGRPIRLKEIPALIKEYPDGLYPETTASNFIQTCGGYGCRHTALPVRSEYTL